MADTNLKKKQLTARDQYIEFIGEEFTKKWESLSPEVKILLSGASNDNLTGNFFGSTTSSGVAKGSLNKSKKQNKM